MKVMILSSAWSMGEGPVNHENVANRLVEDTLTVAVEKNKLSSKPRIFYKTYLIF